LYGLAECEDSDFENAVADPDAELSVNVTAGNPLRRFHDAMSVWGSRPMTLPEFAASERVTVTCRAVHHRDIGHDISSWRRSRRSRGLPSRLLG